MGTSFATLQILLKDGRKGNQMGECCQICGKEYGYIWSVSDELWEKVTGIKDGSGLRCFPCFVQEAKNKGIIISWYGKEEEQDIDLDTTDEPLLI